MSAPTMTRAQRAGVAVLLVYGLKIPVPRDGQPGFRLEVQIDGAVWCHPVGFATPALAGRVSSRLQRRCRELGLLTAPLTTSGGFMVRHSQEVACPS